MSFQEAIRDPVFLLVSAGLLWLFVMSIRRIVDPFWADPARRATTPKDTPDDQ